MSFRFERFFKPKYALILTALLFLYSFITDSGLKRMIRINSDIKKIKQEILEIEERTEYQKQQLRDVLNNPRQIETHARTNLGLIRPNETVYEISSSVPQP